MKIVGLITEYNPFHNGHKLHIEEAKKITRADYCIVIMSGNYVQRGTPAIMDKYLRTRIALEEGADVIFELPTCYATGSAEYFAMGAVTLLNSLGIIDSICFGSECGDIETLYSIANFLANEPLEFKTHLTKLLKTGISYPVARSQALLKCTQNEIDNNFASILTSPNNILGIEYIKALLKLNSNIKPYTIKRQFAGYHNNTLDCKISSASGIRLSIQKNQSLYEIKSKIPKTSYPLLTNNYNKRFPIDENDFSLLLQYKLLSESFDQLTSYQDVSYDLAKRINHFKSSLLSYSELSMEIKTKQITLTRVNRALLHIMLNISKIQMDDYKESGYSSYARLLGFQKESSILLRMIKEKGGIPVITKVADASKVLKEPAMSMLNQDIFASHLYNKVIWAKYKTRIADEYTHGVIIN